VRFERDFRSRTFTREYCMNARMALKRFVQSVALVATFPSALVCGFGRIERFYTLFAHLHALLPGFIGEFCRAAFYKWTLRNCSIDTTISFGSFFSRSTASVEPHVSIGAYCVIGCAHIGARTQIASHVQIPSGAHGHLRDADGRLADRLEEKVVVGCDCWIGSSAVVMANVGAGTTIGAGSVVVKEIPAGVVAVGNPAKAIRETQLRWQTDEPEQAHSRSSHN
jgi:virginiamycin A acetyltransferase